MKKRIADILLSDSPADRMEVWGWVRTKRESRDFVFLEVNDGSCLKNLQAIVSADTVGFDLLDRASTGAAVHLEGSLVPSISVNVASIFPIRI